MACVFHDSVDTRKFDYSSAVSSTLNDRQLKKFGLTLRDVYELLEQKNVPSSLPQACLGLLFHKICGGFQQSGYHGLLQTMGLYAPKVKDKKNAQLRISSTFMSLSGYLSAKTFQAAVTPATESTRVPSISNRLPGGLTKSSW